MIIFVQRDYGESERAKKAVLKKIKDICAKSVELTYSATGKPLLDDGYISFAHTENVFVAAYSSQNIGVDIEKKERKVTCEKIGDTERWTQLEAFAKWTGEGVTKSLLDMQIDGNYLSKARIASDLWVTVFSADKDIAVCEIF
ncbi:MAG: hypothetical protein RR993_00760 [Clostridia bacterium]